MRLIMTTKQMETMMIKKIETVKQYNKFKEDFYKIQYGHLSDWGFDSCVFSYESGTTLVFELNGVKINSDTEFLVVDFYNYCEEWNESDRCFKFEKCLDLLEKGCNEINKFFLKYYEVFDNNGIDISHLMDCFTDNEPDTFDELCERMDISFSNIEKKELSKVSKTTNSKSKTKSL